MAYSQKEREQYNQYRLHVCAALNIRELDYNAFRRLGSALHRLFEENCNGTLEDNEYEEKTDPLYEKAEELAKRLKLYIYFQTDPRGGTIYLDKQPIPRESYNNAHLVY